MKRRADDTERAILYLTFDGILQSLAFSQVARVVTALARRGFRYHLVSVERGDDLADRAKVETVQRFLLDAGVEWSAIGVDLRGTPRTVAEAVARVAAQAFKLVTDGRAKLIHARGYQSAAIANTLRKMTGVPYLFDARGCWIEERTDWFSRAPIYAAAKIVERTLYRDALAVVTLTELHRNDVVDGAFGRREGDSVVAIPTCADYDDFRIGPVRPGKPMGTDVVPLEIQKRLAGRIVLGIVGALNRSYLASLTLSLVKRACNLEARCHLLVLTPQQSEYRDLLTSYGFSADRMTVASARHADMPSWMHWMDWGLLLLGDTIAKRGSMPTKLAEFFASGVRPVVHGCNSEVTAWVRRAGSGIVLESVAEGDIEGAAAEIAASTGKVEYLHRARAITAPHFSLATGIDRYASLLHRTR
jgi:hypothetical protein